MIGMPRKSSLAFAPLVLTAVLVLGGSSLVLGYQRYNDGCQSCHGAFTDGTSPKGSTFPSNNKHTMHRASSNMNTACNLCHSAGDGNDPFIGSSTGTAANPGIGCNGCHPAAGLRLHHANNGGAGSCGDCHGGDPTPAKENIRPPYYGTVDTKATNPCNPTATTGVNENWTTNCCEGSDTDGDNLYDGADPDCQTLPTPGEAGATANPLRVTAYNRTTKALTISFGPACSATNNNIEYGLLANVRTYGYSGQVCNIGNTGTTTFTLPTTGNFFFLVVGHDATAEGSYGKKRIGTVLSERPEDSTLTTCPYPQNLTRRCD